MPQILGAAWRDSGGFMRTARQGGRISGSPASVRGGCFFQRQAWLLAAGRRIDPECSLDWKGR